jgi:hypothetical protein
VAWVSWREMALLISTNFLCSEISFRYHTACLAFFKINTFTVYLQIENFL